MININIDKGSTKHLMIGIIVLVTGICYFLTIGDPDLLDAIRNSIYPDSKYFETHNKQETRNGNMGIRKN